jgi:hypothetical protein
MEDGMIALRLTRLIETHSDELAKRLLHRLQNSGEAADFQKVPALELQQRTEEIYHNLGDWLLNKTERDIEKTYTEVAKRRAAQGVAYSQLLFALVITKDHLWEFLKSERFTEELVDLYGELELFRQIDHFFDRALYYAARAYEHEAAQRATHARS